MSAPSGGEVAARHAAGEGRRRSLAVRRVCQLTLQCSSSRCRRSLSRLWRQHPTRSAHEVACCLVGSFLREEVPGRDRAAVHLLGPGSPYLQRLVPAGDGAALTPQGKRRAGDSPPSTVGFVVLVVERGGGGGF